MTSIPTLTLRNDVTLPALGLGVFQTPSKQTAQVVRTALETGYRHLDTAASYDNERGVGEGLRTSGVDREDVVVQTKIWISDYGHEETLHGFEKSAAKLGLDQIDVLLLHLPLTTDFDRTRAAWGALEELYAQEKVRAIGVSNFSVPVMERLLERAEVVPMINQIEVHPTVAQREVQELGDEHGILTQAWSPIGGISSGYGTGGGDLQDAGIATIAEAQGKSPAQVILAWHLQQGRSAIPKSTKPERLAENLDVADIELSAEELDRIDALDSGERTGDPDAITVEAVGREIPEA